MVGGGGLLGRVGRVIERLKWVMEGWGEDKRSVIIKNGKNGKNG